MLLIFLNFAPFTVGLIKKRMLSCKVTIILYIIISISTVIKLILNKGKPFAKSARDFCICVTSIQEKGKI